jgi:hypothetical protein
MTKNILDLIFISFNTGVLLTLLIVGGISLIPYVLITSPVLATSVIYAYFRLTVWMVK